MTRCSPPLFCRKSTSFFYKVLIAMKRLQSSPKHQNGVALGALVEFMEKHHHLTGDACSQVRNALRTAENRRLVFKGVGNLFVVAPPAAVLHTVPAACVKGRWEDVKKSFGPRTRKKVEKDPCKAPGKTPAKAKNAKGQKAESRSRLSSPCKSESNSIVSRDPDWCMNETSELHCCRTSSTSSSDSC